MPDRELEERAAASACWALGNAKAIPRDDGTAPSTRDFDLLFDDGHTEPLEVTVHADRAVVQTSERLGRSDKVAPSLTRVWTVDAPPSALESAGKRVALDVRRFLQVAEPAIAVLEANGIHRYDIGAAAIEPRVDVSTAYQTLLRLGSQFGFSREPIAGEQARIEIGAGVGGVAHGDLIAVAAEAEAAKPDNQLKLSEPTGAPRTHLFVVVDGSTGPTLSAGHNRLVGRLPALPPPITTIWVAVGNALYVTTPPDQWQVLTPPLSVFHDVEEWIIRP